MFGLFLISEIVRGTSYCQRQMVDLMTAKVVIKESKECVKDTFTTGRYCP